jgi:hypothetical protein
MAEQQRSHQQTRHVTGSLTGRPLRRRKKCVWCRRWFKPAARGPVATYCSASCRQQAYQRRRLEKAQQDRISTALAKDLREAKQLDLKRALRKIEQLERENEQLRLELQLHAPDSPLLAEARPCAATNRKGQPCKANALSGSAFCEYHDHAATPGSDTTS